MAPETKLAEIWPSGRAGLLPMKEGTCVASTAAKLANMTVRTSMKQKSFLYKPCIMRGHISSS
jgi:hypothetical protein